MKNDVAAGWQAGKFLSEEFPLPALGLHSGIYSVLFAYPLQEHVEQAVIVLCDGRNPGFDLGAPTVLMRVLFNARLDVAFGVDVDCIGGR
ncbi:hypothetical protein VSX64_14780 [Aurantimonas sp. C2-6-R+9]|uniref:hypothetical protein n=1 Tax=unclassified Aurantimonas TaxID=2638230 RepID=UPI002E1741BD|nr:hypothetical protein [Aurantimonas sp. C2-6-R+9]